MLLFSWIGCGGAGCVSYIVFLLCLNTFGVVVFSCCFFSSVSLLVMACLRIGQPSDSVRWFPEHFCSFVVHYLCVCPVSEHSE